MFIELSEEQKNHKIAREAKELQIKVEAALREQQESLSKEGLSLDDMKTRLQSRENFTEEEWELIHDILAESL